jgi:p-cumate 2,3-dioxygenase beta subunit
MKITREQVEDFLYMEAELLDEGRLNEWAELLTEDATYQIPSTDVPDGDPTDTLYLVADNRFRIDSRVKRLRKEYCHVEFPRSRTSRHISNVRIVEQTDDSILVHANFIIYRMRYEKMDTYVGKYVHRLVVDKNGQLKIKNRKSILALESLRPQSKVSIII